MGGKLLYAHNLWPLLNLDAILALQESWRGKIVISLVKYRNNNNYYAGMLKFEAKIKE